jgi:hypothetical protein
VQPAGQLGHPRGRPERRVERQFHGRNDRVRQ